MKLRDLNISYHIQYNFGSTYRKKSKKYGGDAHEYWEKGGVSMEEVRNLNGKRVCDMSRDHKVVEIVQKGCLTRITANPDGTLKVENVPLTKAA